MVRVLGTFEATVSGRDVALGGPRQRAVLARVLIGDGDAVTAEQIVDDVWGGRVGDTMASSVHAYVSRLRQAARRDRRSGAAAAATCWTGAS